jgi:hypothetical protein
MEPFRRETIERTAAGDATTDEAINRLDAIRWLRRVCYHAWRITCHLTTKPVVSNAAQETMPIDDKAGELDDLD